MKKVVIQSKNRIFNDFFKIDEAYLSYERFDGRMSPVVRRLNFERGDSVAALIFNPETQKIILVNQFKYPSCDKGSGWITETIAGMVDKNETPEAAIRREVLEETGYNVEKLKHISTFYVSPGGSSERIVLFYVEVSGVGKVEQGGGVEMEQEDIMTVELTVEEAQKQIENGEIADAKTIIGIMWFQDQLIKRQSTG
jgi:ADP-ribose pyrophosphatase